MQFCGFIHWNHHQHQDTVLSSSVDSSIGTSPVPRYRVGQFCGFIHWNRHQYQDTVLGSSVDSSIGTVTSTKIPCWAVLWIHPLEPSPVPRYRVGQFCGFIHWNRHQYPDTVLGSSVDSSIGTVTSTKIPCWAVLWIHPLEPSPVPGYHIGQL